jgi:hypothetical protein
VAIAFEPLPLVIGVTGHFDLRDADLPLLRKEVEAVFDRLERDYANPRPWRQAGAGHKQSAAMPMIVLSALGQGADQLVVRAALARGLQVIAALPLPIDSYRLDFEWDLDRAETMADFEAWMTRPDIHKLFVGFEKGNSPDDVRMLGHQRNLQYRRAGAFIARHCDVLIALWDGKADASTGCTAEIVGFKRHGIPLDVSGSARLSLDAPETGPVIHIVTPRAMKKNTAAAVSVPAWGAGAVRQARKAARHTSPPYELAALDRDHEVWMVFEATVRQSRDFNREADRLLASAAGRAVAGQNVMDLFEVDKVRAETTAAAQKAISLSPRRCVLYAVADALAQSRRKVFRRDWGWLAGLGLTAFACFEAFSHLAPAPGDGTADGLSGTPFAGWLAGVLLLSGGIAALAAMAALYAVAIRRRHQERLMDYRTLAEVTRVTVFWNLAGIDSAAHAWPVRMPRELAWAQTCLRRQELSDWVAPSGPRSPLTPVSYGWIRRMWVEGQLRRFTAGRSQHLKAARCRARAAAALLTVTAALAAAVLFMVSGGAFSPALPVHAMLLFALGILPAVAAVLAGSSERLAFSAVARRHDRMAGLFARALAVLPPSLDAASPDAVRDALRDLGNEALRDTASWLTIRRRRSLTSPESGRPRP